MTILNSPSPQFKRRNPYFIALGVVFVVGITITVAALTIIQQWQSRDGLGSSSNAASNSLGVNDLLEITLFYVAENGLGLVEHSRDIAYGNEPLVRARTIIEYQLGNAPEPLVSPFPEGTTLRSLYLTGNGNAFVDLSPEVTNEHSGGSLDELFTVYSLVNALAINVPEINAVQIMINGSEVDTLAGHIDLRQPLEPNMQWVIDPNIIDNPENLQDIEDSMELDTSQDSETPPTNS